MADMEVLTALAEQDRRTFINPSTEFNLPTAISPDGETMAVIDGVEYPLVDKPFDLKIIQPGHVSKDKSLAPYVGKVKIEGMDEYRDTLKLLPITVVSRGRRMFSLYDPNSTDNSLICYSVNGVVPSEKVLAPMSTNCCRLVDRKGQSIRQATCPQAVWEDGKKPACSEVLTVAFLDLEWAEPVTLQLRGTGMGAWSALSREYATIRNVARLKRTSMRNYYIVLTCDNKGTYVTPKFQVLDGTAENLSKFQPLVLHYLSTMFSKMQEDEPTETLLSSPVETLSEADMPVDAVDISSTKPLDF